MAFHHSYLLLVCCSDDCTLYMCFMAWYIQISTRNLSLHQWKFLCQVGGWWTASSIQDNLGLFTQLMLILWSDFTATKIGHGVCDCCQSFKLSNQAFHWKSYSLQAPYRYSTIPVEYYFSGILPVNKRMMYRVPSPVFFKLTIRWLVIKMYREKLSNYKLL